VFCVSVGLLERAAVVGVVYDPVREELFRAAGGGAPAASHRVSDRGAR
jgi:fructose-1,6-bisphosphatase/inositol monophosphatase family enzyme